MLNKTLLYSLVHESNTGFLKSLIHIHITVQYDFVKSINLTVTTKLIMTLGPVFNWYLV